ncbi:MAG: hypothetical protein Kow0032_09200 [Methyloligellaceae bacterium]
MRDSDLPAFAAICYRKGFHIDALLAQVCSNLVNSGLRLGGLLQVSRGGAGGCATSVHTHDLRTGEAFDIWEERGSCASACRLDERGLLAASVAIEHAIADKVDLIVINRFGRAESLGRGLLDWFVRALEAGIPVLTAVREPYDEAWAGFHGGLAADLAPDVAAVCDWARQHACAPARAEHPDGMPA